MRISSESIARAREVIADSRKKGFVISQEEAFRRYPGELRLIGGRLEYLKT